MNQLDDFAFAETGPGSLAGRYPRSFWQPVYRAQDLAPGQAVPVTIMSERFTLYRGVGGTPHLVGFRCAHRGTQLSTGWVEDDCIRCLYHGWKYDSSGQCVTSSPLPSVSTVSSSTAAKPSSAAASPNAKPSPTQVKVDTIVEALKTIDASRCGQLSTARLIDTSFMDGLRTNGFLGPAEARQP